jgi:integrase
MPRPIGAEIRVWDITARARVKKGTGKKNKAAENSYIVRWTAFGQERSKSFQQRVAADAWRSNIIKAITDRETFSRETGLPVKWSSQNKSLADWSKEWIQSQLATWEPNSRESAARPIISLLILMVKDGAPKPPEDIRSQIAKWLIEKEAACPSWLALCSISMNDVNKATCEEASQRLYLKQVTKLTKERGKSVEVLVDEPRAATVVATYRSTIRAMFNAAITRGLLTEQPWPSAKRGKKRNKEKVQQKVIRVEDLPGIPDAAAAIDRVVSHQPASWGYRAIIACILYAGLRPGEARALRIENITFPDDDGMSGTIFIEDAVKSSTALYTQDDDKIGPPKTVEHEVTMVPPLAVILKEYIGDRKSGLLFATRSGSPVTHRNLYRAWKRATPDENWTLYDLRHTCATHWLGLGIDIKIIADWLGHSPAVLLDTYAGVIKGSRERAAELAAGVFKKVD